MSCHCTLCWTPFSWGSLATGGRCVANNLSICSSRTRYSHLLFACWSWRCNSLNEKGRNALKTHSATSRKSALICWCFLRVHMASLTAGSSSCSNRVLASFPDLYPSMPILKSGGGMEMSVLSAVSMKLRFPFHSFIFHSRAEGVTGQCNCHKEAGRGHECRVWSSRRRKSETTGMTVLGYYRGAFPFILLGICNCDVLGGGDFQSAWNHLHD